MVAVVAVALMVAPGLGSAADWQPEYGELENLGVIDVDLPWGIAYSEFNGNLFVGQMNEPIGIKEINTQGELINFYPTPQSPWSVISFGAFVFVSTNGGNQFYRINIKSGTIDTYFNGINEGCMIGMGNYLYLLDFKPNAVIYKIDTSGTITDIFNSGLASSAQIMTTDGEKIYFTGEGNLYGMNAAGSFETLLTGQSFSPFCVYGNGYIWAYSSDNAAIYKIPPKNPSAYKTIAFLHQIHFMNYLNRDFLGTLISENRFVRIGLDDIPIYYEIGTAYDSTYLQYASDEQGNIYIDDGIGDSLFKLPCLNYPTVQPVSSPHLWSLFLESLPMLTFAAVVIALVAIPLYYGRKHTKAPRKGRSRR